MPSTWQKALGGAAATSLSTALTVKVLCPWLAHDLKMMSRMKKFARHGANEFSIDAFLRQVVQQPTKTAIIFEGREYTYGDLDEMSNGLCWTLSNAGVTKTVDRIALLMRNEAAYVVVVLAAMKLGVPLALLNYNLKGDALLHCLKAVKCTCVIVGKDEDLSANIKELDMSDLCTNFDVFVFNEGQPVRFGFKALHTHVASAMYSGSPVFARVVSKMSDIVFFMFTSGTTGLPKAARIPHARLIRQGAFVYIAGFRRSDIFYTPLPMYHGSALFGTVIHLGIGATAVIGRKFSASSYWNECRLYKATIVQYIGEVCRYLLAAPPRATDGIHEIRMALGNGLHRDIWTAFQQRFRIPQICEFYAATEGLITSCNIEGVVGSIGKLSPLMNALLPSKVFGIRYDVDSDAIVRNAEGYCTVAGTGEPALYIAEITNPQQFDGYEGPATQNEAKVLRDVFRKGDVYFNSGDLLMRDSHYNLYFADRVGDTFRWKGENVSTLEVANFICRNSNIKDATVYGVKIPGHDGRGGMASICVNPGVHVSEPVLKTLYKDLELSLPEFARPLLLRFIDELPLTGTFKHRNAELVKQGYDPSSIPSVYYSNTLGKTYSPLDSQAYADLVAGHLFSKQKLVPSNYKKSKL